MITFALIGYGQRGKFYLDTLSKYKDVKIAAVCDVRAEKRALAKSNYNLSDDALFETEYTFFDKGRLADVLIIASPDQCHYDQAVRALKLGYHLILEKPIARSVEECREIAYLAREYDKQVYVCHVLRYAPLYTSIKEMIDEGKLGKVISVQQTEHVGWWHQAHSFVRGNWRKGEETNPMIVAKCCHDLDLFVWLTGKNCVSVSSYGSLAYFKRENAPDGSGERCYDCKLKDECIYNCLKFYTKYPSWAFASGQYLGDPNDKEAIIKAFSSPDNPYTRCVFKCDNDVVDNQVVNCLFEDGSTAQLNMTAFCEGGIRTIRVCGTEGMLEASMLDNIIKYWRFGIIGQQPQTYKVEVGETFGGHGGGDEKMVDDILKALRGDGRALGLTSIDKSIMSHLMGFAAERSRRCGGELVKIDNQNTKK